MKLGASTIPYSEQALTAAVLESFADAGVESLELSDFHPNFVFDDASFTSFLQRSLRNLGVHLNSIHIHLKHREDACDLATLDRQQRDRTLVDHCRAVDLAEALGGCILVSHDIIIPEPKDYDGPAKRTAFVENLAVVAEYARARGVRLALENTGNGYTREPERLVGLMEDVDAPNVGVVIDTGHRNINGDPAAALRVIGKHLITLHLHDNHGATDEHLLPGRGTICWDEIMRSLSDIEYAGVLMYEVGRPGDLPSLVENAAWLQGLR